jgi:hypothetical protein
MSADLLQPLGAAAAIPPARALPAEASAATPTARALAAPPMPNPRLRLDPSLSLVVIEFRDAGGEVSQSIPSPKELAAYRDQPRAEPGEAPATVDVRR